MASEVVGYDSCWPSDHGSSSDSSDSPAFIHRQRIAAIRREAIPSNMDDATNRAAVICGIRAD